MTPENEAASSADLATAHLGEMLEYLCQQGHSQVKVATEASLPPQYLSDIKHGRRPMTELVARQCIHGEAPVTKTAVPRLGRLV